MDDVRDLQQQLAAMQATNAALAAQRAEQDARIAAMQAELSSTRASEATVRAAADAHFAAAFKGARPERFTGSGSPELEEWLFRVGNYATYMGLPEDQRVFYAQSFMGGAAFHWWVQLASSRRPGPGRSLGLIKKRFAPLDDAEHARRELRRLRQGHTSMEAHVRRFQEVVNRVPMLPEADQVRAFIYSLNPKTAEIVALQRPQTLDHAMELAITRDDIVNSMRRPGWEPAAEQRVPNAGAPVPMELGALRDARRGSGGLGSKQRGNRSGTGHSTGYSTGNSTGNSGGGGGKGNQSKRRMTREEIERRRRGGRCLGAARRAIWRGTARAGRRGFERKLGWRSGGSAGHRGLDVRG